MRPGVALAAPIGLVLLGLGSPPWARAADPTLPDVLDAVFQESLGGYAALHDGGHRSWAREHGLDPADAGLRERVLRIRFFHDLFTCDGAVDGPCPGALGIPYLWHWVDPNPRHRIVHRPSGQRLVDRAPPARFGRYATAADVDRVPSLFLGDLVSREPRYEHPIAGTFHTFGWCSEREMAYALLLRLAGIEGRIVQAHGHVWTELWLPVRVGGAPRALAVRVDNTFDELGWTLLPAGTDREAWLDPEPSTFHEGWYNRLSRSRQEIDRVRALRVPPVARERIRAAAARLRGERG